APDFSLPTLSGGSTLQLSDFRGRLVLLTFWATWCAPCREEMPDMQALWQRYKEQGFSLLAVNIEMDNQKQVKKFVNRYALTFPILLDPKATVRKRYEIEGLPTSYLIDRRGRFLGKIVGNQPWESEAAQQMIASLLKGPSDPSSTP
ncbi:MAG: TlpA family protein disulfide reductase, partial [Gammaproteobacteria bacterium]